MSEGYRQTRRTVGPQGPAGADGAPGAPGTTLHSGLTDVSSDQHHAAAHTLTSHSTRAHSELTGIGAADHHSNANDPTANEKAALAGTSGTAPSGTNKLVDNADTRMTNVRTPTAHASTHTTGTDKIATGVPTGSLFLRDDFSWQSPGAASTSIVVTEQDFGSTPVNYAEFAITDANVLAASDIHVQLLSEAPAALRDGVAADADEAEMEPMDVWASNIAAGSFTLIADVRDGPVTGPYKFGYLIG